MPNLNYDFIGYFGNPEKKKKMKQAQTHFFFQRVREVMSEEGNLFWHRRSHVIKKKKLAGLI